MSLLVRPECKMARVVRRPPDSESRKSEHLRRDPPGRGASCRRLSAQNARLCFYKESDGD